MQHSHPDRKARATDYQAWLNRARCVVAAIRNKQIEPALIPVLQRFVMESGHYNAPFTLDELEHLGYPKSPFANMAHHTYLRSHQTWAAEILRLHFHAECKIESEVKAYPIFLDSPALWDEITLFCHVVHAGDLAQEKIDQSTLELLCQNAKSPNDIWILLPADTENVKANYEQARARLADIRRHALVREHIPAELHDLFLNDSERKFDEATCRKLDRLLAVELVLVDKSDEKRKKKSDKPWSEKKEKEKAQWSRGVFGVLKKQNPDFLTARKLSAPEKLLNYAKESAEQLEEIERVATESVVKPAAMKTPGQYRQAVNLWIKNQLGKLSNNYYYVVPRIEFRGLQTLLVVGEAEAFESEHWGLKAIINRLGYRATLGRTIEALLRIYPELFINETQTQVLWQHLLSIQQITDLPEDEIAQIAALPQELKAEVSVKLIDQEKWVKQLKKLGSLKCEEHFEINKKVLQDFAARLQASRKHSLYPILLPELQQSVEAFCQAAKDNTPMSVARAAYAAQAASELLCVFFATTNDAAALPRPIADVITTEYMPLYPIQHIATSPYAMRAYLRVLQACILQRGDKPLKVLVTNQNYFESLMNLQGARRSRIHFSRADNLYTTDLDTDVIFTEIHPNNSTGKRIFTQKLATLIRKLDYGNSKVERLTIVIDATLNSLNEHDLRIFLDDAEANVKSGKLNIVILQSLTKFFQPGYDKCAAGLNILINNGVDWAAHNACHQEFAVRDTVDTASARFFDYFANLRMPDQAGMPLSSKYLSAIITNNNTLYSLIADFFPELGSESHNFLRLVPMSDFDLSYVALNTAGILSAVDPDFRLEQHDLEKLNNDIRDYLIKPIARRLGLPLTNRLSIGFQLSSVTVALDSLRFTVGNESVHTIWAYASLLNFVAKTLQKMSNPADLFVRDESKAYLLRIEAFTKAARAYNEVKPNHFMRPMRDVERICFGPFGDEGKPFYFARVANNVFVLNNNYFYDKHAITVIRNGVVTPLMKIANDEIDFLFHSTAYVQQNKVDRGVSECGLFENGHPIRFDKQLRPLFRGSITAVITEPYEQDPRSKTRCHLICTETALNDDGINIEKRRFSHSLIAIDMHNWGEKDPTLSRYLNLCVAVYLRFVHSKQFMVKGNVSTHGSMYQQFLFAACNHHEFDDLLDEAVTSVRINRDALLKLKEEYVKSEPVPSDKKYYAFDKDDKRWTQYDTSYFDGPCELPNASLVDKIVSLFCREYYLLHGNPQRRVLSDVDIPYPLTRCRSSMFTGEHYQPPTDLRLIDEAEGDLQAGDINGCWGDVVRHLLYNSASKRR